MSIRNEPYKPYLNGRVIVNKEDYDVIYRPESLDISPFCNVCSMVLRTKNDEEEAKKHGCCYQCAVLWVYPNIAKWTLGWRPSSHEIASTPRDMINTRVSI